MEAKTSLIDVSDQEIEDELLKIKFHYTKITLFAAVAIYPMWFVLDYLFAREVWLLFLSIRIIQSILLLVAWYFFRREKIKSELVNYLIFAGMGIQIAFMCNKVPEDAIFTYFLGFSTLFVVCNILTIWKLHNSLIIFVISIASYFLFYVLFSNISFIIIVKDGFLLLITIATIATLTNRIRNVTVRKEIFARLSILKASYQLESAYNQIKSSINYAKRIQKAVFPSKNLIEMLLPQHFILFKPRDVVSGDFYFIRQIKNFTIIAAADCTGHGIPGAFMSMLGIAYFNEIVQSEFESTSAILDQLRDKIKTALNQSETSSVPQDGMDIALCIIDIETKQLTFSGANSSLIVFRNNQINEYKPDRMPVSIYRKERPFSEITIDLQQNDMLYLFSDGYYSQFSGQSGHTLKKNHFKEILSDIHLLSMEEQKLKLENNLTEWQGAENQVDDILVIGIRIGE